MFDQSNVWRLQELQELRTPQALELVGNPAFKAVVMEMRWPTENVVS